jgi:hypothetical protein
MIKFIAAILIATIFNIAPVLASPQQYPTKAEIKILRQQFQQQIKKMKSDQVGSRFVQDRRSAAERQARNSFVKSWTRVDPIIAPFLGSWGGYEDTYHIYPSNKQHKVCIIGTGEGRGRFTTGYISNGYILTTARTVLFRENIYLGSANIYNGKPQIATDIPYSSPQIPRPVAEIIKSALPGEKADQNLIHQGFKENGCTSTLPK